VSEELDAVTGATRDGVDVVFGVLFAGGAVLRTAAALVLAGTVKARVARWLRRAVG
jgi:hypothetical protein